MILLIAVLIGLLAGFIRGQFTGRFSPPNLHLFWLALVAFLPQWLAFQFPPASRQFSTGLAAAALVGSQLLLLAFVWVNRREAGFWLLCCGLMLNLIVITLNGGLMPISPETAHHMLPLVSVDEFQVGERFGLSKDVLLQPDETRLEILADRFVPPSWFPYQVAFSLGDLLISMGAFWLLWEMGKPDPLYKIEEIGI